MDIAVLEKQEITEEEVDPFSNKRVAQRVAAVGGLSKQEEDAFRQSLDEGLNLPNSISNPVAVLNELTKIHREMKELVSKDPLTSLLNRRGFAEALDKKIRKAERASYRQEEYNFCVLSIDLDKFKIINDQLGHPGGDEVLKYIGQVLETCIRPEDVAARVGGEEFSILVETDLVNSLIIADRIRQNVDQHWEDGIPTLTLSIGITSYQPGISPEVLLEQSDKAAYLVKENGRNAISIHNIKSKEQLPNLAEQLDNLGYQINNLGIISPK